MSQQGHQVKGVRSTEAGTGSRSTHLRITFSRSQIKRTISAKLAGQRTEFR